MATYLPASSFEGVGYTSNSIFISNTVTDLSSAADNEQFGAVSASPTGDSWSTTTGVYTDTRLRLRAKTGQEDQIYGLAETRESNLLAIMDPRLTDGTNGLLFPFTPTVTFDQSVSYNPITLVHTNYGYNAYQETQSPNISVTGKFAIQNQRDGAYAMAVIHFLRTVSKSYFGETDKANKLAGLPPPVLILDGYGSAMFNEVPVVVTNHTWTFGDDVDLVTCTAAGLTMDIPVKFDISLTLAVQQTPQKQRTDFSLDAFRTGELMRTKKGWI